MHLTAGRISHLEPNLQNFGVGIVSTLVLQVIISQTFFSGYGNYLCMEHTSFQKQTYRSGIQPGITEQLQKKCLRTLSTPIVSNSQSISLLSKFFASKQFMLSHSIVLISRRNLLLCYQNEIENSNMIGSNNKEQKQSQVCSSCVHMCVGVLVVVMWGEVRIIMRLR